MFKIRKKYIDNIEKYTKVNNANPSSQVNYLNFLKIMLKGRTKYNLLAERRTLIYINICLNQKRGN